MEAAPVSHHTYPGMQAQLHSQAGLALQAPQIQTQGQMPSQQDGYAGAGAAAALQPPPVNSYGSSAPPLSGQKRDSSGATVPHGSHDSADGNFVKLFVGSVPRTITEDEVRPMFAEHGNVLEVAIIKDKRTGNQQGCCFIKYSTVEEAERAIRALHNQQTLPGGVAPVQVRYADGERERLGSDPALPFCAVEHKLFVGSLNKQASEKDIEELFIPYGRVDDVYIMRDEQKQSRGCAFIKYSQRDMAQAAITALNGIYVMPGCDQPLAVRFADPKRPKGADARVGGPGVGGPGFSPRQGQQGQQGHQGQHGPGGQRPMQAQMGHTAARGPPMGWRPLAGAGNGPPPQAGPTPYGAPAGPRGGPVTGVPQMGGMMGAPTGMMNGHPQGPMAVAGQVTTPVMLAPPQQQTNQGYYQQAPQQRPQQQYALQPQQQQQQQMQQQMQMQQPYVQVPPPQQQQPQAYMQQQVPPSRPVLQVQPQQQLQQQPQQQPQVLMQLQAQAAQQQQQQQQRQLQQLPEQQVVPQQMGQLQTLQPGQQQPQQQPQPVQQLQAQQIYYQVPLVQPMQQQLQQPTYFLPVQQPPTLVAVAAPQPPPPPATCDWSEHTSPEGYKYYYNSVSGESKWEKPEELLAFEQQQQTQIPIAAVPANPLQQQFTNTAVIQHPMQGMSYMQPQPVNNGSVEQPRQQGPPGANLFVFRIPDDFTDESMKDTFAPFGNVISARVGVERESGRNRGFGFVSFDSAASAEAAIQGLNNVPVGGRRLKVERKRGEENGTQGY